MGRTFVMGDIHGAHKALLQCLERSKFDKKEDTLIHLGDICDGWNEVYQCVEELLTIPHLIPIRGNHDEWFETYINTGIHGAGWKHGGFATLKSYGTNCLGEEWKDFQVVYDHRDQLVYTNLNPGDLPETHKKFFKNQVNTYKDEKENIFVHGGFNRHLPLRQQHGDYIFYWDRDLWASAMTYEAMDKGLVMAERRGAFKVKEPCKDIFIGHTTTINWKKDTPMKAANIWNLDTGAGFYGKLTIMDVETKEYWQSDLVRELYPDQIGRN